MTRFSAPRWRFADDLREAGNRATIPGVLERFSAPAREVVALAVKDAESFSDGLVGVESLLVGLLQVDSSIPGQILRSVGVTADALRKEVASVDAGSTNPARLGGASALLLTSGARRALEMAVVASLGLGSTLVEPEHLLRGMIGPVDGVAVDLLVQLGIDVESVRGALPEPQQGVASVVSLENGAIAVRSA